MGRQKVFVTRNIGSAALKMLRVHCELIVWPMERPPSHSELVEQVRIAHGLLCLLTEEINADVIRAAPHLKVISNCAVGVDNIDVAEATRRGIPVANTPDVVTDATADLAFALLLATARRVVEGANYVRSGKWKSWDLRLLLGRDLRGSTLGLVGFGRIGRAVAKRAAGFDMRLVFHDPSALPDFGAAPVDLHGLLRQSDFISLHVPLTPQTRHMINGQALSSMKPNAVLVNTSRGPIIDPKALYEALKSRRIFGAGLDVTEPEPIRDDDPLLTLDNCVILPHLGTASERTREQMAALAAGSVIAGLQGQRILQCVNPEVYAGPRKRRAEVD